MAEEILTGVLNMFGFEKPDGGLDWAEASFSTALKVW